ncbi:DUF1295 domain-containing protein [Dyella sp.]|uniref:DUF1295 domain-containing protein n=1 Tax=Dyella sp. TaxID=1869338 RepID=UPI002ED509A6
MNMLICLGLVWLVMILVMCAGWAWQRKRHNAGIVDVLWSAGIGLAAIVLGWQGHGSTLARTTVAIAGSLWSTRLAWHLWRRVRNESEDGRYRYLREHWGGHQGWFFAFFQGQALLVPFFALPFAAAASQPGPDISLAWVLAIATWIASVVGESLADRQLARFRQQSVNRGRTCRDGLWRYSRHPNYFFEWLHWFTYVALAWGAPLGWLAWTGPVLMFVFLRWISGIPFTEAQALRHRGDDYRQYQQTTSMLIPWFPKTPRTRIPS